LFKLSLIYDIKRIGSWRSTRIWFWKSR